jgi:hypothetical protein
MVLVVEEEHGLETQAPMVVIMVEVEVVTDVTHVVVNTLLKVQILKVPVVVEEVKL